jgi:phosphoglycolate phosphatase-like HAD superfamily hydrolase
MRSDLTLWTDGVAKAAILDFVSRVTRTSDPDFVPPTDRVAVFDNDGTLWCEQPMQVEAFFLTDRLKTLAERDPSMREREPFRAFLEHDQRALHALGKQGIDELLFASRAGMNEDEFDAVARTWFRTARHPKLGRRFTELAFLPQLELLNFLRRNGFKTFIVSGGGIDLIRAFAEEVYGIPREHVVGSSSKTRFEMTPGAAHVVKLGELNSFDDREGKPQNIALHIGRRPLLCVGNSDGDLAMLRYTMAGAGLRLGLLLHHDDATREFAYDREFALSPLAEALDKATDYGLTVVSMKDDWKTVFEPTAARVAA